MFNSQQTSTTSIIVNYEPIINPSKTANGFNNYGFKSDFDYLTILNTESFYITSSDIMDVSDIIFVLNQTDRPNSIPSRILNLFNKDISDQLTVLLSKSFSPLKYFFQF